MDDDHVLGRFYLFVLFTISTDKPHHYLHFHKLCLWFIVLLLPSGSCKWSDQPTMNKRVLCKDDDGRSRSMEPALSSLAQTVWKSRELCRGHLVIYCWRTHGKIQGIHQRGFKFTSQWSSFLSALNTIVTVRNIYFFARLKKKWQVPLHQPPWTAWTREVWMMTSATETRLCSAPKSTLVPSWCCVVWTHLKT